MRILHPGGLLLAIPVLALLAPTVGCAGRTPRALPEGAERVEPERIDDLLRLPERDDVDFLVLDEKNPQVVSTVHATRLREWVEDGGVLWVAGDGLDGGLVQQLVPLVKKDMDFWKRSTGQEGGELIVRDESPRLVIEDHPLTEGVERLYLFPVWRFDGTEGAEPLVRMTDVAGDPGTVIAAVPLGEGYVVLDGTAREKGLVRNRLPGFDPDHPNALELDGQWKSYDWERMLSNARRH